MMVNARIITIPNILSFLRIFLVPFFILAMNSKDYSAALKIVIVAGLTDSLDGIIARKFNQISKLGVVLDPLADKFLLLSIMITFYINELAPKWFIILVFIRDALVAIGWLEIYLRKKEITKPTMLGKASNASQVIIFGYILLATNFNIPPIPQFGYFFVSFLAIVSLLQYILIRNGKIRS
ncbi:CDP-diacylglycerol--glycerol-3-phosphate 3-phosphatidyltransferase [Thermodesulfovibrio aggregans]|uniref:CDP-diacylglycerol--glycerol-3-phosphate 3-phosphatidyltransferase n=1 Tax=Thermodesulfovibrio aggregans TaxID=86166 RepID=A0A0U9HWM3_9BACT|nr:CDP-alcohol phosphatidyltransferase family protein [Thermodesulfovibrio aggregans]GAQ95393.1 CDP-diacylglycerol--glycerol-3-phosphate 3-phosphatidyltransferase [Thermodesulfovibrio aggregans]